jgi:4-amino-4-deoxy-L-arabinose transferase-like glycosyltransferase
MTGRKALILLMLLLFWAVSLRHLAVVPSVYEDEPWQASTGWKIATEGVFGSDLFAGFYGMEQHYYGFMPLHPFLLAGIFRLGGLGLFQARIETVLLALLALSLTLSLGKRLFYPGVGLLAVIFLLLIRTTGTTPSQISGILYIDIPRISRYDMLVPVFGLAALHAAWSATGSSKSGMSDVRRNGLYGLAGFLAGFAGLSHLYGIFWFVALALLVLWRRSGRDSFLALCLGFILPWLPYLLYVLQAPADWTGQTSGYSSRFDLLTPSWYWRNAITEASRYGPGLGALNLRWLFRPGFWAFIILVPISLLTLGIQTLRGEQAAATLFIPALTLPLLFALLIYLKLSNYLVTVFPLLALATSWFLLEVWRRSGAGGTTILHRFLPGKLLRAGLVLLLILVAIEGAWRIRQLNTAAAEMTPYEAFARETRAQIPSGSRVLGLHTYWLGLADYDYLSWTVPLLQIDASYWTPPLNIGQALDNAKPEAILIDPRIEDYLQERPLVANAIYAWMAVRGFEQVAVVEDATYGPMKIYLPAELIHDQP